MNIRFQKYCLLYFLSAFFMNFNYAKDQISSDNAIDYNNKVFFNYIVDDISINYKKYKNKNLDHFIELLIRPCYVGVKRQQYYQVSDYNDSGSASWYGERWAWKDTATRAIFDPELLTAAHRKFPIPSIAKVTNKANNRTIYVLINDRGPYAFDRVIDLSRRASHILGIYYSGHSDVDISLDTRLTNLLGSMYSYSTVHKDKEFIKNVDKSSHGIFLKISKKHLKDDIMYIFDNMRYTGTDMVFKDKHLIVGPMHGINAYMIYLTLKNKNIKSNILFL